MAQISFRMDDDLKMSAEDTFKSMGMTMSTAINIFVAQTVRSGQFPFVIKADPFYSEPNMSVLRRRAKDMDEGRNIVEHDLLPDGELVHA
jgi:DNA-damage-inducible protein J